MDGGRLLHSFAGLLRLTFRLSASTKRLINTYMDVHKKDIKQLHNHLKASAKKRNINFTLTFSELCELSFPITCPVLNIPLQFHNGSAQDNSYSVDRIDSTKGYTIDNIVIVSNRANRLKSDATLIELKRLAEYYSEPF